MLHAGTCSVIPRQCDRDVPYAKATKRPVDTYLMGSEHKTCNTRGPHASCTVAGGAVAPGVLLGCRFRLPGCRCRAPPARLHVCGRLPGHRNTAPLNSDWVVMCCPLCLCFRNLLFFKNIHHEGVPFYRTLSWSYLSTTVLHFRNIYLGGK